MPTQARDLNPPLLCARLSSTGYEPTSMRAIRARYDPYVQTRARVDQLRRLGHSVDKAGLGPGSRVQGPGLGHSVGSQAAGLAGGGGGGGWLPTANIPVVPHVEGGIISVPGLPHPGGAAPSCPCLINNVLHVYTPPPHPP